MSELHSEGEMTFDQAAAAIEGAASTDPDFGGTPEQVEQVTAPDQADEQPTPGEESVPDPGATTFDAPDVDEDSLWSGENINPDLLPDELKPLAKQFEAAYTRKTQTLAEQRKELEALGSLEELKMASEFYGSLRDPEYLRSFYNELGDVVREMGLVEDDPAAPAADEAPAPAEIPQDLAKLVAEEPELAPFAQQMAAMRQELDGFRAEQMSEREALEQERSLMAEAAEISRQVDVVREQHPNWGEDDWEAVYDLADANDGNVLRAAEIFNAINDRAIAAWTAQKGSTPAAVQPIAGGGTVTEDGSEPEYETLKDVDKAAQAYLDANDLSEFTG